MYIEEKLSMLTDEQLLQLISLTRAFDCTGIDCYACPLSNFNGVCLSAQATTEELRRREG